MYSLQISGLELSIGSGRYKALPMSVHGGSALYAKDRHGHDPVDASQHCISDKRRIFFSPCRLFSLRSSDHTSSSTGTSADLGVVAFYWALVSDGWLAFPSQFRRALAMPVNTLIKASHCGLQFASLLV